VLAALAALTALAAAATVTVALATAAIPADAYVIHQNLERNWATGRCLDSNFDGDVYTLDCNWGPYQYWFNASWAGTYKNYEGPIEMGGTTWFRQLEDYATGRCLTSDFGGYVYTLPCDGSEAQGWEIATNAAEIGYNPDRRADRWISKMTGMCLDSNHYGYVYTLPCNSGAFQNWKPWY
jgi:serine/threonine-protein kinase